MKFDGSIEGSYSDAINSYELYCYTSTFCFYVIYFVKGL